MAVSDAEFEKLLSIVDRHAGKVHRRNGLVAAALREVLAVHELMMVSDAHQELWNRMCGSRQRQQNWGDV